MSQREKIVAFAVSQLGYKEGANDKTKYGAWYGMDYNPWCAFFVSWCANRAEIPNSVIPRFSYVPTAVTFFKKAGGFRERRGYTPKPGDIAFFGRSDHVGIVEKVVGNQLYTIEGNTSEAGEDPDGNGVYRKVRPITSGWLMGFGVPAYEEDEYMVKQQDIYIDGKKATMKAVEYEDENYIRLRDIAPALGYSVGWDAKTEKITVVKNK